MTFALAEIRRLAPVARVVVAETKGSVPREVGASMLVTADRVEGTIGGGALEFEAIKSARDALMVQSDRFERKPLGPSLGQCCGGAVSLLTEVWDEDRLNALVSDVIARPLPGKPYEQPLAVKRILAGHRSKGIVPRPGIVSGWMIEPQTRASRSIWVWGAGHVGRAIVTVLAPLPDLDLVWIDTAEERFPRNIPHGVTTLVASNPASLISRAPNHAEHLVLTFSHALDLELCHGVLSQGFAHLGLIGSATKRARFRSRLKALGHTSAQIDRMECPIGDPGLGKHPQEIALGVAAAILRPQHEGTEMLGERA
jgi:xanthine dehydrogenase accessory factor